MKPLRVFGKVICDESEYDRLLLRETEIQRTVPTYYGISDTGIGFIVYMMCGWGLRQIIKAFPYNSADEDYVRRCAEELLDKLNEDI